MRGRHSWRRIIRFAFTKRHAEQQVDDELQFHVEGMVERLVAQGKSEKDARRQVMERFESYDKTRCAMKTSVERKVVTNRWELFIDGLIQDTRVSWRQVIRRPGFAVLAIVILGLGIGASTTMFSVVESVLLEPLPYPNSQRLVYVGNTRGGAPIRTTAPEFLALRRETHTLESYTAYFRMNCGVILNDRPEQLLMSGVTEDYVDVFGAYPVLGRAFSEEDFHSGATRVALLSHAAWQRHWGGAPEVIGTVLTNTESPEPAADFTAATIIGVMPAYMDDEADLWLPLHFDSEWWSEEYQFSQWNLRTVGRLGPEASLAALQAETAALAARHATEYPQYFTGGFNEGRSMDAVSLLDRIVESHRAVILMLFAGAIVLLAVSVTNLSGLFLSRALDRQQELAIRTALGGGRSHILRHLVTETIALSLVGGAAGFVLATGCLAALRTVAPADLPRLDNLSPDVWAILFATLIAVVSGLICALVAQPSRRIRPLEALLRETNRTGAGRGTARLRGLLISAQVALAVILLVGAGLLSTSLGKLRQVDPGFEFEDLVMMPIRFPVAYPWNEARNGFMSDLIRRIEAVPGVESASWTPDPPLYWRSWGLYIRTEGTIDLAEEQLPVMGTHPVGPDFFSTMGIPTLQGRGFTWADDEKSSPVAVVDELAAARLWPAQNAIGKKLDFQNRDRWYTVVGVVGRLHHQGLNEAEEPEVYIPAFQAPYYFPTTVVTIRSSIPKAEAGTVLRDAAWDVDPTVLIPSISSVEDRISDQLRTPRFIALLGSAFSLSALILTLTAIFAHMSYWVGVRTREMGIRMALGAQRRQMLWTVLRQCLLVVLLGAGVGLVLSAGSSRLLGAILFDVSSVDLRTYALVGFGISICALLASLTPAIRAARVDPTVALQGE